MGKKKASRSTDHEQSEKPEALEQQPATCFEESLSEVESVVESLEAGELSLEESLRQYEQGVKALRSCFEHLRKAERKIELLVGFDDSGQPVTEPFSDDANTLEEKQISRSARRGNQRPPASSQATSKSPLLPESSSRSSIDARSSIPESNFELDGDGDSYVDDSPGLF